MMGHRTNGSQHVVPKLECTSDIDTFSRSHRTRNMTTSHPTNLEISYADVRASTPGADRISTADGLQSKAEAEMAVSRLLHLVEELEHARHRRRGALLELRHCTRVVVVVEIRRLVAVLDIKDAVARRWAWASWPYQPACPWPQGCRQQAPRGRSLRKPRRPSKGSCAPPTQRCHGLQGEGEERWASNQHVRWRVR